MNEYIQILLELKKGTVYAPSEVSSKILKLYPELGNEIILPINMDQENNTEIPIFVFQQNSDFQIFGNFYNIVITCSLKLENQILEIVNKLLKLFEKTLVFTSLAFYFQYELSHDKIEIMYNKFFNKSNISLDDNIQLSITKHIKINNEDTLFLEGYLKNNEKIYSHFEYNFIRNENRVISYSNFSDYYNCVKNNNEDKAL